MGAGTLIEVGGPLERPTPRPRAVAVGLRSVSSTLSRRSASFLGEGGLGSLALSSSWLMNPSSGCHTILRLDGVPIAAESPSTLMSMSRLPSRLGVSDSDSSMTLPPATDEVAMGSSAGRPKLRRTVGLTPGSVRVERYSRISSSPNDGLDGAARLMAFQLRLVAGELVAERAGEADRRPTLPARDVRAGVPASEKRPERRLERLGR